MLTFYKCNSGFSGMPAADSRSFSRHYHDRESHAIHCYTYNFPLAVRQKRYETKSDLMQWVLNKRN